MEDLSFVIVFILAIIGVLLSFGFIGFVIWMMWKAFEKFVLN